MTNISEAAIQAVHEINLTCIPTFAGGQPIEEPWRWDLAEKIIQAALDEARAADKVEIEHLKEAITKSSDMLIDGIESDTSVNMSIRAVAELQKALAATEGQGK